MSIRIVLLIYAAHRFGLKLRTLFINTKTVSCDCVIKWQLILEGMSVREAVIVPEFTELDPYKLDLKLFSFRKRLYSINSRILTQIIIQACNSFSLLIQSSSTTHLSLCFLLSLLYIEFAQMPYNK